MYGAWEANRHLQTTWGGRGRPRAMTETVSPTCVTSEPGNSMFCEGNLKDFPGQCATHKKSVLERESERERIDRE